MNDFQFMPKIMKQLAWVQFFSWFALSLCGFTPPRLLHIYGTTDTTSEAYNTGANQVGEMFANYNLIAAIAAFFIATGKIYESKIHALCRIGMRWTWVLYPSISYKNQQYSLWNGLIGVGICRQVSFLFLCDVIRFF
jgi:hypothetical protein